MAQVLTVEGMLARVPVRVVPFEVGEDGKVTLLRPKFVSPWLKWMQNFLSKPVFKVRLDEVGSFTWLQMDGTRTAEQVCAALAERFGDRVEPVQQRGLTFLYQMMEGRFAVLQELKSDN